jgi:hypothetical protein
MTVINIDADIVAAFVKKCTFKSNISVLNSIGIKYDRETGQAFELFYNNLDYAINRKIADVPSGANTQIACVALDGVALVKATKKASGIISILIDTDYDKESAHVETCFKKQTIKTKIKMFNVTELPLLFLKDDMQALNEFTIGIDFLNELKTLSLMASDEEVKYYLMGVNIQYNADTTQNDKAMALACAATNGNVLAKKDVTAHSYFTDDKTQHSFNVTVPTDFINKIADKKTNSDNATISLHKQELNNSQYNQPTIIRIVYNDYTYYCKLIDGNYPDYMRAMYLALNPNERHKTSSFFALADTEINTLTEQLKVLALSGEGNMHYAGVTYAIKNKGRNKLIAISNNGVEITAVFKTFLNILTALSETMTQGQVAHITHDDNDIFCYGEVIDCPDLLILFLRHRS